MNADFDPGRAWVISVGIERYAQGERADLPGAAASALRFANWAAAYCHVPAERVVLACSWLEEPPPFAHEFTLASTTREALNDELTRLANESGDLLLLYWCGHGVINERSERVLFTSDSTLGDKKNLGVDDMLEYLASTAVKRFGQQVLLIDACANFAEKMNLRTRLPVLELPRGAPREVSQFTYFAAAQGQVAAANRVQRETTFSASALDWLEQHSRGSLPPDVRALRTAVNEAFGKVAPGASRQRPVFRWVQSEEGEERVGNLPVAGTLHAALATSPLSGVQAQRVLDAIAERYLSTPEGRARVITALGATTSPSPSPAGYRDLADHLAGAIGGEEFRAVLASLRQQAETEAEELTARAIDRLWQRQLRIAPVLGQFSGVTAKQVRTAYLNAVPAEDDGRPSDLDDALDRAAQYEREEALHRLVGGLEHATGVRIDDGWYGLAADRLSALRQQAVSAAPDNARLVIDLRSARGLVARPARSREVRGGLRLPDGRWAFETIACSATDEGVRDAVNTLLEWAYSKGIVSFTVGFMLPRAAFGEAPERWEYGDRLQSPTPLWYRHPAVLHCAERHEMPLYATMCRDRAAAIKLSLDAAPDPTFSWIRQTDRHPDRIRDTVRRELQATCFGLAFVPDPPGDLRRDPLIATVTGGVPFVLWTDSEPPDWDVAMQLVLDLVTKGDFESLPTRLRDMRLDDPAAWTNTIRIIWDDPDMLPKPGQLAGMPGAED